MIEAMKQALEALETAWYHVGTFAPTDDAIELYDQARTSLRQAIEQAEKREPVATWENKYGMKEWQVHALRAGWSPTPPQRTWVGLTRAERFEIEKAMSKYYDYRHQCKTVCLPEFSAAIEAKLKEKNT